MEEVKENLYVVLAKLVKLQETNILSEDERIVAIEAMRSLNSNNVVLGFEFTDVTNNANIISKPLTKIHGLIDRVIEILKEYEPYESTGSESDSSLSNESNKSNLFQVLHMLQKLQETNTLSEEERIVAREAMHALNSNGIYLDFLFTNVTNEDNVISPPNANIKKLKYNVIKNIIDDNHASSDSESASSNSNASSSNSNASSSNSNASSSLSSTNSYVSSDASEPPPGITRKQYKEYKKYKDKKTSYSPDGFDSKNPPISGISKKQYKAFKSQHTLYKYMHPDELSASHIDISKTDLFDVHPTSLTKTEFLEEIFADMRAEGSEIGDTAFLYISGHSSCDKAGSCQDNTMSDIKRMFNNDEDNVRRFLENVQIMSLTDTSCILMSKTHTILASLELLHGIISEDKTDVDINDELQFLLPRGARNSRVANTAIDSKVTTLHRIFEDPTKPFYMNKLIEFDLGNLIQGVYLVFMVNGLKKIINLAMVSILLTHGFIVRNNSNLVMVKQGLNYGETGKGDPSKITFLEREVLSQGFRITDYILFAIKFLKMYTNKDIKIKVIDASCSGMPEQEFNEYITKKIHITARGKRRTNTRRKRKRGTNTRRRRGTNTRRRRGTNTRRRRKKRTKRRS